MPRYKLTVEYDGTPYAGWQRQKTLPSVQQTIEDAIFRMTGETVTLQAAGRTDAGVHALQSLVLVNHGAASGHDLLGLAHRIQADILQRFGVALEMEPNLY